MSKDSKEFNDLLQRGEALFMTVVTDLNRISKAEIRPDPQKSYRRLEDWQEICVALALLDRAP